MYKRSSFYTFSFLSTTQRTHSYQRCIKRCMLKQKNPWWSLTASRVLLLSWFLEEWLCKLDLRMVYTFKMSYIV